jgi:hypothetical protein
MVSEVIKALDRVENAVLSRHTPDKNPYIAKTKASTGNKSIPATANALPALESYFALQRRDS